MFFAIKNPPSTAHSLLFNNNNDDNIYNIKFNTNKNNKKFKHWKKIEIKRNDNI